MNPADNNESAPLTRLQKLAVLLLMLGPDSAAAILKQFDDRELEAVSTEMARLNNVSQETQRIVLREFAEVAVEAGTAVSGGAGYVRAVLEKAIGQNKAAAVVNRVTGGNERITALDAIIEAEARELFNIVKQEQPQTIALLASYLPPAKATALLNECPADLRDKVVERLASLTPTPIEVIEKIAGILGRKLGFKATRSVSKTGGVKSAADLLNILDRNVSKTVLTSIEERNPDLGKAIRNKMFTFDDMLLLDNTQLQKVMREVDTRDLAMALKKANERVKAALLGAISKRAAETVLEEISFLGGAKAKDMEAAQQRIIEIVRKLEGEGEIEINRGGEETKNNEVLA